MLRDFFFFQAEDGIRDLYVTGVQTCALPIYHPGDGGAEPDADAATVDVQRALRARSRREPGERRRERARGAEIGRASCRERVEISVVAVALKKKETQLSWVACAM